MLSDKVLPVIVLVDFLRATEHGKWIAVLENKFSTLDTIFKHLTQENRASQNNLCIIFLVSILNSSSIIVLRLSHNEDGVQNKVSEKYKSSIEITCLEV